MWRQIYEVHYNQIQRQSEHNVGMKNIGGTFNAISHFLHLHFDDSLSGCCEIELTEIQLRFYSIFPPIPYAPHETR